MPMRGHPFQRKSTGKVCYSFNALNYRAGDPSGFVGMRFWRNLGFTRTAFALQFDFFAGPNRSGHKRCYPDPAASSLKDVSGT